MSEVLKVFLLLIFTTFVPRIRSQVPTQRVIVFPPRGVGVHSSQVSSANITCKENELLYPGETKGDWFCDCKATYLYYPTTGTCYEAYTQGPCENDEVLIFPANALIPRCVHNNCSHGLLFFNQECHRLNSEAACSKYQKLTDHKLHLQIDASSMKLVCGDKDFIYKCTRSCCKSDKPGQRNVCLGTNSTTRRQRQIATN